MSQNWTEAWTRSVEPWPKYEAPNIFSQFQPFNPFQPSEAYQVWQKMLQQYFDCWAEFWTKNRPNIPSPNVFKEAQRQWMDRLFERVIGIEERLEEPEDENRQLWQQLEDRLKDQERLAALGNRAGTLVDNEAAPA